MPKAFFALLVIATASTLAAADATARDYPFCLRGCDFGAGDCSFSSYQQCQASASGRNAYCDANPYFNANAELQPNRTRQSKRKF